jgi:hypothetical protein
MPLHGQGNIGAKPKAEMIASVEGEKIAFHMAPLFLRWYTRLTSVFSKPIEHHEHHEQAVALHITLRRIHRICA